MLSKLHTKLIQLAGICVLLLAMGVNQSAAQQTVTHTVESGETLFGIAEQYNVSVADIKQWNNMSGNTLSVGQTLTIRRQQALDSAKTHTVQPKETLYSISKKYNVSIAELKKWNNLQGANLSAGTELRVYPQEQQSQGTAARQATYTVKSGDSLYRIAEIHEMTVQRLKELNNLQSNNIRVGQQLAVQPTDQPPSLNVAGVESSAQGGFVRHEVEESQSLRELLEKFKMDEEEFRALNPGFGQTSLRRGDQVNVLAPANQSFKNPYTVSSSMREIGTAEALPYDTKTAEPTTSGELYNPSALTAAHSNIAMGSVIFVQNSSNQRGVFVRINDRITGNGLKLSQEAWQMLGLNNGGNRVTLYRSNE